MARGAKVPAPWSVDWSFIPEPICGNKSNALKLSSDTHTHALAFVLSHMHVYMITHEEKYEKCNLK